MFADAAAGEGKHRLAVDVALAATHRFAEDAAVEVGRTSGARRHRAVRESAGMATASVLVGRPAARIAASFAGRAKWLPSTNSICRMSRRLSFGFGVLLSTSAAGPVHWRAVAQPIRDGRTTTHSRQLPWGGKSGCQHRLGMLDRRRGRLRGWSGRLRRGTGSPSSRNWSGAFLLMGLGLGAAGSSRAGQLAGFGRAASRSKAGSKSATQAPLVGRAELLQGVDDRIRRRCRGRSGWRS